MLEVAALKPAICSAGGITMNEHPIPDDIQRFILASIESVPYLEALLLLRKDPSRSWSAEELAGGLFVGREIAAELLQHLHEAGFASPRDRNPPRYAYDPASTAQAEMVDRLAESYAKHLIPVTALIHAKGSAKIRRFADAFRLRKE